MRQSMRLEDAFGLSSEFVGIDNFVELFKQQAYLDSFRVTAVFSVLVAVVGSGVSLLLRHGGPRDPRRRPPRPC